MWRIRRLRLVLVIKCDQDNQAKSKNVIGMLTHVVDQTFAWLTGTVCFQQSLGSFPASPAGPQLKLYKQMNSKPCFLLAPGLVWLALAGVWLAPGRALWRLAGTSPGPGSSPPGSRVPGKILIGWNSSVILKLQITNLIKKTAKQLCFTAFLLFLN